MLKSDFAERSSFASSCIKCFVIDISTIKDGQGQQKNRHCCFVVVP